MTRSRAAENLVRSRVATLALATLALAALFLALARPAAAQGTRVILPEGSERSLIREMTIEPLPPRAGPPLTMEQRRALNEAMGLRAQGLTERARDGLQKLLASAPHHPRVLHELAGVLAERSDWAGIERLARAERLAARDSLLLAPDLALALERLSRPREGAQVVIEAWIVEPAAEPWANETLSRFAAADARAVREALRRANLARPERGDLARAFARHEWTAGSAKPGLAALAVAERIEGRPRLRASFAEELLGTRVPRDSSGAVDVMLALATDRALDPGYRTASAQRAWEIAAARGAGAEAAPLLQKALADLDPSSWSPDLRLGVAKGLRDAGRTPEARAVLSTVSGAGETPGFALERALADLRDGPPARALPALRALSGASPEGAFRYAEGLFYAGEMDSAHARFEEVARNPSGPRAGEALERLYLLEEPGAPPRALAAFGRLAWERWRGEKLRATAIADTLYRTLPRGALWAQSALALAELRLEGSDKRGALAPLLAVADSLPADRLAPLARQRAAEAHLKIGDERAAIQQYEECLARYPKAWNAPEVRRRLEALRRDRRF